MRIRLAGVVPSIVAASTIALALLGQGKLQEATPPPSAKQQAPPSNTDFSVADLSGVWNAASGVYNYAAFSKDEPPMTPWGQARYAEAKPSQGDRGVKLTETNDRVYKCAPPGMPYIYIQLFPMQLIQTAKEVIELFEYDHVVRYIYTDGRKHPTELTPSYNGHSIGHWEGDTLVVDTIGFNGKNWLDRVGHPESSEMHIVEHIRRVDAKTLQVDLAFDDPKSYAKPWSAEIRFLQHPEWEIMEHVCEDNLAFESFEH